MGEEKEEEGWHQQMWSQRCLSAPAGTPALPNLSRAPAITWLEGAAGIPASAFSAPVWKPGWRTKSSLELGLPPPILLHVPSPVI